MEAIEAKLEKLSNDNRQSNALTTSQAAEYCGWSSISMRQLRSRGLGPIFFHPFGRAIRYLKSDLDAWLQEARDEGAVKFEMRQEAIKANTSK